MSYETFIALFRLFIDGDVQGNKIKVGDYTISYSKPSLLGKCDSLSYYKENVYFGDDYIDRGGIYNLNGDIIFHSDYGVIESSYSNNNIQAFESFEQYLDYRYREYISASERYRKETEKKMKEQEEYIKRISKAKQDILNNIGE